ncbi:hypothetical protein FTO74_15860 [Granulicella sp. WH15]|uniref:hypothetical protein n=1 Tax=Granulicella sp. WH15 TaxID=2602070 RepID=UPI0013671C3B|nr:hypothetical protein [Granulicella sp. WH15]QHN04670.1 hypothetical protein FTO74_15860 [Granulicella sp. WH15]
MTPPRSILIVSVAMIAALVVCAFLWHNWRPASAVLKPASPAIPTTTPVNDDDSAPTTLWAHNIRLRKGPHFRVYILWIRGEMLRINPRIVPSLDAPESFIFNIRQGVIHANIGDLAAYLNAVSLPDAPLKQITVQPDGERLRVHGLLKKIVPLPVEIVGGLSPLPDGDVRFHIEKISLLKIPMKGLLGALRIQVSDIVGATRIPGIQISDNDIIFDTSILLPPPHIRGQITSIHIDPPDVEVVYGNAHNDEVKLAQWHNFLRLSGGTINFGKFTMHQADLTMIDVGNHPWFGLDLSNYQAQLTRGYARITPASGIEAYMPDMDERNPATAPPPVTIDTLRNRNNSIPGKIQK